MPGKKTYHFPMYAFVMCAITALVVWALFALGTQDTQSTAKKPGDQLSDRGVTLVQAFFWIVVIIGFVAVLANSNN
jgi:ABC-type Fe3+ transport system permease subunit